jgi:uncharacterized protein YndB with AHSA1/START domain
MSQRSTQHATFVIDRVYAAPPARVFAAWATPEAKARWYFCNPDWVQGAHELDFRVGGRERLVSGPAGGTKHIFAAYYHDIVPDERIVYSYDMHLDDTRISVSLATIELRPAPKGTRLVFTEQLLILDGHGDVGEREHGTRAGLANLETHLHQTS